MNLDKWLFPAYVSPNVGRSYPVLSITLTLFMLLSATSIMYANTSGNPVYTAASNETTGYARVIQLQHSTSSPRPMLATFERWFDDGSNVPLIIRQSLDNGATWSTLPTEVYDPNGNNAMYQPFLFELPIALPAGCNPTQPSCYPAGTLLLVANSIENNYNENLMTWRSTDQGAHWTYVGTFQTGYSGGTVQQGVWEPFLYVDSQGRLVCVFSDQRQEPTHDQLIGQVISTDGGNTWGAESDIVIGPAAGDTPGMPTVARMGNGSYILATEACGPSYGCSIHTTISPDGANWPGTVGSVASTADGRTLYGSPYLVYSPNGTSSNGSILLTADAEFYTPSSLSIDPFIASNNVPLAPENHQVIFVNNNNGTGSWSWMGGPFLAAAENATRDNPNYSPALLLSSDGESLTEMCSTTSSPTDDEVTTGTITPGLSLATESYTAPFASTGKDAGWVDYNGIWSVAGGVYSDTNTSGSVDKALAGSTGWTDYVLSGDVMITSGSTSGQAGFLVRASNPTAAGFDGLNGYYIGVNSTGLFIGRENGSWTGLGSADFTTPLAINTWYHVSITVQGSAITATGTDSDGTTTTVAVSDSSFLSGAIGVRDLATTASWKAITVTPLSQ